jgi:hypothetical protein
VDAPGQKPSHFLPSPDADCLPFLVKLVRVCASQLAHYQPIYFLIQVSPVSQREACCLRVRSSSLHHPPPPPAQAAAESGSAPLSRRSVVVVLSSPHTLRVGPQVGPMKLQLLMKRASWVFLPVLSLCAIIPGPRARPIPIMVRSFVAFMLLSARKSSDPRRLRTSWTSKQDLDSEP